MARGDQNMHRHASPAGVKIPLNDDDAEKARRIKKRSMLQEVQIRRQSFRQPATPRKGLDGESSVEGTPRTPRNIGSLRESLNPITPLRRAPLVVNFEEWMKMANDNKINAQNSWNFALIDYFHDMSLLKEGESINFQKASCTLDGCVKIYTSRVDSVATETGKLLSGLADSGTAKSKGKEEDEEGDDAEEDEDGEGKKKKKRTQRSSEATLAKDFSSLQLKKLELEFSVDPLFKKASADFDEGGAKGLLLNHLSIDTKGRIVFDSSDDIEEVIVDEAENQEAPQTDEIDLSRLRQQFFPDLNELDELDVCPSLKTFDLGDPSGSLDIPFLKALDERNEEGDKDEDDISPGYDMGGFDDDDDDFGMPGADGTMAFGEGGVVWANETLADAADRFLTPSKPRSVYGEEDEGDGVNGRISELASMGTGPQNDDILSYFDEALKKNWAGPEHWKMRRIKDNTRPSTARPRKEKEAFEIDFMNPEADVTQEMLLPQSNAQINLPKTQRKSKGKHLLPDDKHFNSRNLIQLFIKPNALFGPNARKRGPGGGGTNGPRPGEHNINPADVDNVEMNEEFWAKQQMEKEQADNAAVATGNYDANFFNDEGMDILPPGLNDPDDDDGYGVGGEAFEAPLPTPGSSNAPAPEVPPSSAPTFLLTQDAGNQLVTANRRVRPEYVQYAKVAKKVDVRRLKENIWKELDMEILAPEPTQSATPTPTPTPAPVPKKFTEVIHNLQQVYPKNAMSDISTSYCFICVLHLANEKGLVLQSNETLTDLRIEKDLTANGPDEF